MGAKPKKAEALHPRFAGQMLRANPHGLEKLKLDHETRIMFERQSLEIFTECANSGLPFRDCLSAILISGFQWGVEASRECG